jgi:hypothetical protein
VESDVTLRPDARRRRADGGDGPGGVVVGRHPSAALIRIARIRLYVCPQPGGALGLNRGDDRLGALVVTASRLWKRTRPWLQAIYDLGHEWDRPTASRASVRLP